MTSAETSYVAVAQIQGAWGLRGHVRIKLLTDFPKRLVEREHLYLGESFRPVHVDELTLRGDGAVMKLRDVDDAQRAGALRGQVLYVLERDLTPLPEGTYYWHQIVGLEVRTTSGENIGRIVQIIRTGSNDVYVVQSERGEVLVPAIEPVIVAVDLSAGVMTIEPIPGML